MVAPHRIVLSPTSVVLPELLSNTAVGLFAVAEALYAVLYEGRVVEGQKGREAQSINVDD